MSAISFLGDPVVVYRYGFIYMMLVVSYVVAVIPVGIWFAPKFHRMNIVSAYEVFVMICPHDSHLLKLLF